MYQAAIIKFSDYAELLSAMTSNKSTLYKALDKINALNGTDLSRGFSLALEQYTHRIMIFLTDGDGSWNTELVDIAIDQNIKVYTIGSKTSYAMDRSKARKQITQTQEEIVVLTQGITYHYSLCRRWYRWFR